MAYSRVPVAVLIFKNNNNDFIYKAYSPMSYENGPNQTQDDLEEQYNLFMTRLWNHINYDFENVSNNHTNYGRLQEIHTRHIDVPLDSRGNMLWISTYDHPHCNYRPVHRPSPIFFSAIQAENYASVHQDLVSVLVNHETV